MSTSKYNPFVPLKSKAKVKTKHPTHKYTGSKSTNELRSALCVDSTVHTDIFNR